jgi:hypothetical protein
MNPKDLKEDEGEEAEEEVSLGVIMTYTTRIRGRNQETSL